MFDLAVSLHVILDDVCVEDIRLARALRRSRERAAGAARAELESLRLEVSSYAAYR